MKLKYILILVVLILPFSFLTFEDTEVVSVKDRQLLINQTPILSREFVITPLKRGVLKEISPTSILTLL